MDRGKRVDAGWVDGSVDNMTRWMSGYGDGWLDRIDGVVGWILNGRVVDGKVVEDWQTGGG